MPARRGRPKKGERRIDAALDHFAAMGYDVRDVSATVADLLEVYGGPSAWSLLEDGSYRVIQDKLFEKENEEKQKQDQPLLQEGQQVEEEPPQRHEAVVDEASPGNYMSILQVHNEVPAETESAVKEVKDPMFVEPNPQEAIVPLTAAKGTARTRKPCYGWISESEDEEELTGQHHEVHVPSSGGGLLCKRKQVQ